MALHNHRWSLLLCMAVLAWPVLALPAPAACQEPADGGPQAFAGRPLLGQGIALYEARDLAQAMRLLQAALDAGLPDAAERASAHKYLAFSHCTQGQWSRCESSFDAAFSALPGFSLQPYETAGTPWGQAYSRAQERRMHGCKPLAQTAADLTAAQESAPNSRVVTAVAALPRDASQTRAPRTQATGAGYNLRLRVSPWAHVRINGKSMGVTPPLVLLKLPAGPHTVELVSPGFESVRQVMELADGQLATLSHDFDAR